MKYSYAIFDMDGLMFDTENLFVTSFETEVSRATGYRFEREQLKKLIGVNASRTRELFPQLFPGCPVSCDKAYAISHVWMQNYFDTHGVPVKPGLRELLDFLKANGCTCALATSSNRSVADYYLADAHLADYFSVLVCGDEVPRSKPDPQTFLLAMRKLGAQSPAQCAVFEDSRNGLLAGATGGFPVFLVPDLIEPTPEMQALCCATCKTLSDAIALLQ